MGILLTALLLTGCAEQQAAEPVAAADENAEPNSRTVFAMDTVMELSAYGADDALMEAAEQEILGLESRLSVTDAGSEIYALDHNGLAELSPDSHNKTAFLVANIGIRLDDDIHDLGCGLHQVCHSIRWDIKAGSCEETLFFSL